MSDSFPSQASVVVIGGGIVGCSTLYHLARLGISDAVLIEKHSLTSGTTWHSAAQVRALRSSRNLTELIKYSIRLFSSLEKETGQATGWINKGSLSIATNPDRLVHINRQLSLARLYDVRAESISAETAADYWPLMNSSDVLGAVWSPDDGRVSPSDVCAALVKGARNRGARIFEKTAMLGIETHDGRVVGIKTDKGDIRCDAVALCTGLWSRDTAALAGVDVPVWPCDHFYLLTEPVDGIQGNVPTLSDHDSHLYIRDDSGGLLVGCFEPQARAMTRSEIDNLGPFQLMEERWDHFSPMMELAMHRLPCLADTGIRMLLNGPECFTPDGTFMLGEAAETAGFYLGCGMNSMGVASGGGAGMALAHMICHDEAPFDLSEVSPSRFAPCFNDVSALTARIPEVLGEHYAIHYPGTQWQTARALRQPPCHDVWKSLNPVLGQFYGWERPLYFNAESEPTLTFARPEWHDQVAREVDAAHRHCALFDLSTFGKIRVSGSDATELLQHMCANNMDRSIGSAIYTPMLNERGGYVSDLTALRLAEDDYLLYTGTAAIKRDLSWLCRHSKSMQVSVTDETERHSVLGLMGPEAGAVLVAAGCRIPPAIGYFQHAIVSMAGLSVRATRISYVGETGWELTIDSQQASRLAKLLMEHGATAAGLYAQSAMRIEKGYLAFGHDLDADLTPFDTGLEFTLDWNSEFLGRSSLQPLREGAARKRIGSLLFDEQQAVPMGHEPVYHDEQIIGNTTSASYGYRVGAPVALVLYKSPEMMPADGVSVEVEIAGKRVAARCSSDPLFDPAGSRLR